VKRIMVATDGSAPAQEALEVGVDIAAEAGADLTIVHVAPTGETAPGLATPEHDPALREAAEFARGKGLEPDLELRTGDVVEELAYVAGHIEADLLVVGSRGLGTVRGKLLGSVSRRLLDQCRHRPVMVVREGQTSS
jgi:nucleotide-binding universal stress UspA family protein